jgi:hypothetical protein
MAFELIDDNDRLLQHVDDIAGMVDEIIGKEEEVEEAQEDGNDELLYLILRDIMNVALALKQKCIDAKKWPEK